MAPAGNPDRTRAWFASQAVGHSPEAEVDTPRGVNQYPTTVLPEPGDGNGDGALFLAAPEDEYHENIFRQTGDKIPGITEKMIINHEEKESRRKAEIARKSTYVISAMQEEWFCKGKILALAPTGPCPSGVQIRPEDDGDTAKGVLDAGP